MFGLSPEMMFPMMQQGGVPPMNPEFLGGFGPNAAGGAEALFPDQMMASLGPAQGPVGPGFDMDKMIASLGVLGTGGQKKGPMPSAPAPRVGGGAPSTQTPNMLPQMAPTIAPGLSQLLAVLGR
jgi:hypothetical protein